MIIASASAPSLPPSGPVDGADAAHRGDAPDAAEPSNVATTSGDGFGHMLAKRMDDGSADDLALPGSGKTPAADPKTLFGADGRPLATTHAGPVDPDATAPIGGATDPQATATRRGDVKGEQQDPKEIVADAGSDLAAQLALVSQWAALPASMPKAGDGDQGDGLDIKGKLDTVRGTSAKADPAASSLPLVGEQSQAAVVASVAPGGAPFDRGPRGASTSTASVTRSSDLKVRDDAQASVAGERLSLAEAILGKVDVPPAQAPGDAATLAGAFVAQVAAQASSARTGTAANATTPSQLQTTVGTPAWSHEVGQATLRIAANDLQNASLRLNPEHLGPLDVQVRIDNGVAHLAFSAAHAETRQALESSRATLDQLFADQGLKVGDCAVGDSSMQRRFEAEGAQGGSRDGGRSGSAHAAAGDATTTTVTTTVRRALGLVDTFA